MSSGTMAIMVTTGGTTIIVKPISEFERMGAGNKYELRTATPPAPPTPPPLPSPESEYESEYEEEEEEEEESPVAPHPARTPTPPPPQCEICGLVLTENCLR